MKLVWLSILLTLSACKQYIPKDRVYSATQSAVSLTPNKCNGKSIVYAIQEPSALSWSIEQTKGAAGEKSLIQSKHPAAGQISLANGLLNQAKGAVAFNVATISTGDPIRDRLLQEVLFAQGTSEAFRFTINRLIGESSTVATGSSVDMKADGLLELGGRKASLLLPIKISEQDSIYTLIGNIVINTRESRPALNAISMDDKLKLIESTMGVTLASAMTLSFELHLKNNCLPTP